MQIRKIIVFSVLLIVLLAFLLFHFQSEERLVSATPMEGVLLKNKQRNEIVPYFVTHSIVCSLGEDKPCYSLSENLDKVLTSQEVKKISGLNNITPKVPGNIISKEEAKNVVKGEIKFERNISPLSFEEYISDCKDRDEKAKDCEPQNEELCPRFISNCSLHCQRKIEDRKERTSFWDQKFRVGEPFLNFVGSKDYNGVRIHNVNGYIVSLYNENDILVKLMGVGAFDGDWSSSASLSGSNIEYDNYRRSKFNQAKKTLRSYLKSKQMGSSVQKSYFVSFEREDIELSNKLLRE